MNSSKLSILDSVFDEQNIESIARILLEPFEKISLFDLSVLSVYRQREGTLDEVNQITRLGQDSFNNKLWSRTAINRRAKKALPYFMIFHWQIRCMDESFLNNAP